MFYIIFMFMLLHVGIGEDHLTFCGNENCSVPVSEGMVQIDYITGDNHGFSVKKGTNVNILGKLTKYKKLFIEVVDSKKRGIVPQQVVVEKRKLINEEQLIPIQKNPMNLNSRKKITEEKVTETVRHDEDGNVVGEENERDYSSIKMNQSSQRTKVFSGNHLDREKDVNEVPKTELLVDDNANNVTSNESVKYENVTTPLTFTAVNESQETRQVQDNKNSFKDDAVLVKQFFQTSPDNTVLPSKGTDKSILKRKSIKVTNNGVHDNAPQNDSILTANLSSPEPEDSSSENNSIKKNDTVQNVEETTNETETEIPRAAQTVTQSNNLSSVDLSSEHKVPSSENNTMKIKDTIFENVRKTSDEPKTETPLIDGQYNNWSSKNVLSPKYEVPSSENKSIKKKDTVPQNVEETTNETRTEISPTDQTVTESNNLSSMDLSPEHQVPFSENNSMKKKDAVSENVEKTSDEPKIETPFIDGPVVRDDNLSSLNLLSPKHEISSNQNNSNKQNDTIPQNYEEATKETRIENSESQKGTEYSIEKQCGEKLVTADDSSLPNYESDYNSLPDLNVPENDNIGLEQGESERVHNSIETKVDLGNKNQERKFGLNSFKMEPSFDKRPFEDTVKLSNLRENKNNIESNLNIKNSGEQKPEQAVTVEEKAFYETIFDYLPNVSSIIEVLGKMSSTIDIKYQMWKNDNENRFCLSENDCDGVIVHPMKNVDIGLSSQIIYIPGWGEITTAEKEWLISYIGVLSLTAFLATLIVFMYINAQNKKKVKALIGVVNRLENKLLVATKEISTLEDRLEDMEYNPKQHLSTETETPTGEEPQTLLLKLMETEREKGILEVSVRELEENIKFLEMELEETQSCALELHKLLENSLATQANSKAAMREIEELRSLTEKQENEIGDLRKQMDSVLIENQCLNEDNESLKVLLKKLEKECNLQNKKSLELSEKLKDLTLRLDKEMENCSTMANNYKSEICQLRSNFETVEMNLKRSEIEVEELNRFFTEKLDDKTPEDLIILRDDVQLKMLEKMNNEITAQLKKEKENRRILEEHVGHVIKDLNNIKKNFEISEKERNEAVTKLQVLTDYFKEKENQLHKALEEKEKLFTESESKDQLLSQKLAALKEEINNYKLQNEALKKEISDQEGSYKMQLATAEQKRQEHWFAFRQAERKYKESQQEAASLRNRILILESNLNQKSDYKANSALNGDLSTSGSSMMYPSVPSDMLPYPPSNEFIPLPPSPIASHSPEFFPPEPLYSSDERLPPLGCRRIPSPLVPLEDFMPPPPVIEYTSNRSRNDSSLSSSFLRTPPPPNNVRPQYKNRQQQNSIDSPSSGVSLESLDKTGR